MKEEEGLSQSAESSSQNSNKKKAALENSSITEELSQSFNDSSSINVTPTSRNITPKSYGYEVNAKRGNSPAGPASVPMKRQNQYDERSQRPNILLPSKLTLVEKQIEEEEENYHRIPVPRHMHSDKLTQLDSTNS